jgi:hypothetical protein
VNQLLQAQQEILTAQHPADHVQEEIACERYDKLLVARQLREAQEEVARLESRRANLQREMALLDMNLYDARLRHVRAELSYRQLCCEKNGSMSRLDS